MDAYCLSEGCSLIKPLTAIYQNYSPHSRLIANLPTNQTPQPAMCINTRPNGAYIDYTYAPTELRFKSIYLSISLNTTLECPYNAVVFPTVTHLAMW